MPLPAGEFRRRLRALPAGLILFIALVGGLAFVEEVALRVWSSRR